MRTLSVKLDGNWLYWVEDNGVFFDSDFCSEKYNTLSIPIGIDLINLPDSSIDVNFTYHRSGFYLLLNSPNVEKVREYNEKRLMTIINEVLNDK